MDLATSPSSNEWTDSDVWDIFRNLVDRESPISGLGAALRKYEREFLSIAAQTRYEHSCVDNRYFRTPKKIGIVNPTNIEHLTRLIIYFNQRLVEQAADEVILDCLFYVLKGRCHINFFYGQKLPGFFFALHALGAVLGARQYGRFLVVHQGSTIGESRGRYPTLGDGVVVGPHAMVLGESTIGRNVWIAAGALVIDEDIPENSIVLGRKPNREIRPNPRDNRATWFDMEMIA